jgi:hypothetical protein
MERLFDQPSRFWIVGQARPPTMPVIWARNAIRTQEDDVMWSVVFANMMAVEEKVDAATRKERTNIEFSRAAAGKDSRMIGTHRPR